MTTTTPETVAHCVLGEVTASLVVLAIASGDRLGLDGDRATGHNGRRRPRT